MVELQPAQPSNPPEGPGNIEIGEDFVVKRRGKGSHSVTCTWNIAGFGGSNKQKVLYSKYFEVAGYDCRLLVYPSGTASKFSWKQCMQTGARPQSYFAYSRISCYMLVPPCFMPSAKSQSVALVAGHALTLHFLMLLYGICRGCPGIARVHEPLPPNK